MALSRLFLFMRRGRNPIMSIIQKPKALSAIKYSQPIRTSSSSSSSPPKSDKSEPGPNIKKDDIKYEVKFKTTDIKAVFKQFYSLYGPLFVVCHIGVSLTSLGFFSSLVWLSIDPIAYLPESAAQTIGQTMLSISGEGSKFMVAYALHKLILPFRLGGAIWLTRFLSTKIKLRRKIESGTK